MSHMHHKPEELEAFTSVEPVNATLSTSSWEAMAAPAVGPNPGIILTTPGGKPACEKTPGTLESFSCSTESRQRNTHLPREAEAKMAQHPGKQSYWVLLRSSRWYSEEPVLWDSLWLLPLPLWHSER